MNKSPVRALEDSELIRLAADAYPGWQRLQNLGVARCVGAGNLPGDGVSLLDPGGDFELLIEEVNARLGAPLRG